MYSSEIVNILSLNKKSYGTGFFVSPDGNILTCKHVLEIAGYKQCGEYIYYKYENNPTIYKAQWMKSTNETDLALLCTHKKTDAYIPMCIQNNIGLKAKSYGFPNGSEKKIKATVCIDDISDNEEYIQLGHANTVTFGFSGAPLIHDNIAIGIIATVTKMDSNGRLTEIAFAIPAKRIVQLLPNDISKKEICIGYGIRKKKCSNYVAYTKEKLCEECYKTQFSDAIKSIYQAQNYILYQCNGFFIASLKYGISTYYDAIFTIVKFDASITINEIYPITEHVKDSPYSISQTLIITNAKLDDESLVYVKKNKIIIKTKEELLRSLFDFEPYKKDLIKYVKSEQLSTHYIEIYGTNQLSKNEIISPNNYDISESDLGFDYFDEDDEINTYNSKKIEPSNNSTGIEKKMLLKEYVDYFLGSEYPALLILGDYGSGKTSFCYIYTLELLDKFLQGTSKYLPILIKLRGYNKAVGINQLLTDYFVNTLGINNFNILSLKLLLKYTNVVLIFDGFDEIAKKVDFDIKYEVLKEICGFSEGETKIIVTCRPNYFQNATEFKQIFQDSHYPYEPGDQPLLEFIENSIAELDLSQIKQYIESYQNELNESNISISEILKIIANTHDLTDLSKRPFLLYMILSTLPNILKEERTKKNIKINAYKLYHIYTDTWIKREERKNKTLIKQEDKELFCKELAFELYTSNVDSLSYKDFPMIIKKHFNKLERIEDIDYFTRDIQSCSFLTSDRTGEFKFIHKSFMEYFVADRIVSKLKYSFKKHKKRNTLIKQINIILGKTYLSMEICHFINDMINYYKENIFVATCNYFDEINHVAKSNILSILAKTEINMAEFFIQHKISKNISHVDFSSSCFKDKILENISFDQIHFYSVQFKSITFINCSFKGSIFDKSFLDDAKFHNCQFCSTVWKETKLISCLFDIEKIDEFVDSIELYISNKHFESPFRKQIVFCNFNNTFWKQSIIQNCIFNNCYLVNNKMDSVKIHNSTFRNSDFSGTHISGDFDFKDNNFDNVTSEPYEF